MSPFFVEKTPARPLQEAHLSAVPFLLTHLFVGGIFPRMKLRPRDCRNVSARALGRALRACRKRKGITQRAVGAGGDVYQGNISRYESGDQMPSLDTLIAIVKYGLGRSMSDFFAIYDRAVKEEQRHENQNQE